MCVYSLYRYCTLPYLCQLCNSIFWRHLKIKCNTTYFIGIFNCRFPIIISRNIRHRLNTSKQIFHLSLHIIQTSLNRCHLLVNSLIYSSNLTCNLLVDNAIIGFNGLFDSLFVSLSEFCFCGFELRLQIVKSLLQCAVAIGDSFLQLCDFCINFSNGVVVRQLLANPRFERSFESRNSIFGFVRINKRFERRNLASQCVELLQCCKCCRHPIFGRFKHFIYILFQLLNLILDNFVCIFQCCNLLGSSLIVSFEVFDALV